MPRSSKLLTEQMKLQQVHKTGVSFLLFFLITTMCHAQHISVERAMQRVAQPKLTLAYESDQLYAFDSRDGFVLASASEEHPAILGYSDGSNFEKAYKNTQFREFIQRMEKSMTNSNHRIYKPSDVKEFVSPLCTDAWEQEFSAYKRMCPVVYEDTIDGVAQPDTCVVGCVALAMSQVMNYWKWPKQGTGSYTYTDSTGCGYTLTADFGSHTYDWDNMLDNYYFGYNERQANAVAQLMSDCGIAVNMRYGTGSSGAQIIQQPLALINYFGYDEGMQLYYRNFFSQVEWDSIMFHEISAGRPLIVGGWSMELAHSFVCDGYDADGYFHIKFGNPEGDADGYYYFTWLTPDQPRWHDKNNPEGGFNLLQSILAGVQPKKNSTPSKQTYIYAFARIEALSNDCIAVYHLGNVGWNTHEGKVGLALKPMTSGKVTDAASTTLLYQYDRVFALEEIEDTTYSDTLEINIPKNLAPGNYRICPVYEEDGKFYEARTQMGMPNYVLCTKNADGTYLLSVAEHELAELEVSNVVFPDTLIRRTPPHFSFTLHNKGAEYSGRLYYALSPIDNPVMLMFFNEEGISIVSNDTQDIELKMTNLQGVPVGQYYFRIFADIDLFTNDLNLIYTDSTHVVTVLNADYLDINNIANDASIGAHSTYDLSGRPFSEASLPKGTVIVKGRKKFFTPRKE